MSVSKSGFTALVALAAGLVCVSVAAQECDRACLENWVDRYLDAAVDNDPAAVPLAPLRAPCPR